MLSPLPWRSGALAGGLLSVVLLGVMWGGATWLTRRNTGEVATHLFTGLLSLTAPSELLQASVVRLNLSRAAANSEFLRNVASGAYEPVLGVVYLSVAWTLYASGRTFARRFARDGDRERTVAAGATVVAGTVPVVAVASLVFGGDVVNDVMVAGLFVPAVLGVVGATGAWTFRSYRRAPSWGGGFSAGLAGLVVVFALTFLWTSGNVGPAEHLLARFTAALAAFVGATIGGFSAGTMGWLTYALVALPVAVFGYFRARRGEVTVTDPVEGVRAGATVVAGFATLVGIAVTLYAVLFVLGSRFELLTASPFSFLPDATHSEAQRVSGFGIPVFRTLGNYLQAFVVGGVLFPLIVGGAGGALGGYLEGQDQQRAPRGTRAGQQGR